MKITAFYYLSYPDFSPPDVLMAASEVYVEVGGADATIDRFDRTYSIQVCTVGYIRRQLEMNPYFVARSVIVVERFEDHIIESALESILPMIDRIAEEH